MSEYTNTLHWLLEDNYPLTKYNTLMNILGKDEDDSEVQESRENLFNSAPIKKIFDNQNQDGGFFQKSWLEKYNPFWVNAQYLPKYKATIWQVRYLAEAGVPKQDTRIQKLGNYVLNTMYTPEQGFYKKKLACGNADMVWALIKFGFADDPRVKAAFDLQVNYQRFDDGEWYPPKEWPYRGLKGHCYGPNSCIVGISTFLRTLTVLPDTYWSARAKEVKNQLFKFYEKHGVLERTIVPKFSKSLPSYLPGRVNPNKVLTSPHFAELDVVEVISNLLKLGMPVHMLEQGIEYVLSKQTQNKRWILENTHTSMYSSWGKKGEENKWVTYRVLYMLKLAKILENP